MGGLELVWGQLRKYPQYYMVATLLFTLVCIETLSHTYWLQQYNTRVITWVYFLAGVGICTIPLLSINRPPLSRLDRSFNHITRFLFIAGWAYLCYYLGLKSPWLFEQFPIDIRIADMLPVMRVMGRRWLASEPVYAEIPEFWGGTFPIYLPAFWMPYLPAIQYDFEMRWISELAVMLACLIVFRLIHIKQVLPLPTLSVLIPLTLLIRFIMLRDARLFTITQEGIAIAYYLVLAYTLSTRNPYLQGIALALCMLSRYALTFWIPMYLIYVFWKHTKREAIITATTLVVTWGLAMVLTGAWAHLAIFRSLPGIYLDAVQDPLNAWKYKPIFEGSLGFAKFFTVDQLHYLHGGLFVLAIATPILFWLWQYMSRYPISRTFFALCSLKATLLVFYHLLVIPALYLFYTHTFFSLAILFYFFYERPVANTPSPT